MSSSVLIRRGPLIIPVSNFLLPGVKLPPLPVVCVYRAHDNGSIRRGVKSYAMEGAMTLRSGLGVNLNNVKVFNRGREKG